MFHKLHTLTIVALCVASLLAACFSRPTALCGAAERTPVALPAPPADFVWPKSILFLGDDCSLYRPRTGTATARDSLTLTNFSIRDSRAFPEFDLPIPVKIGRKLFALAPSRSGAGPRLLLDAGRGAIGSPSVSFDGQSIYMAMARAGDSFFHIYRLPATGGKPQPLTAGPFHDIDPVELPDGRIAFTSTRAGTFDEYHSPPSRALFAMDAQGGNIQPLSNTIIFDNEPEVMADGRILCIRTDNFFDRGKVETLLFALHPDGTQGHTEFGLDHAPEYGDRLRAFYCGSPAPMPDGRVAFVSDRGIAIGQPGHSLSALEQVRLPAGDVAALPDSRLLCTTSSGGDKHDSIAVLKLAHGKAELTEIYRSTVGPLHSPVYLGPRPRPPVVADWPRPQKKAGAAEVHAPATGFLFCQNARLTQNTTAGWPHVRAMRVLAGRGLTLRSSHSYLVHAGSEVIELGTVPLAPDGSFFVEVPADTPLALQAVDAEGRAELNEMSWVYVRAGERRGCVGCHEPRNVTPASSTRPALALRSAPLKLLGQGRPHRYRGNNAAVTGLMELQFDRFREVAGLSRHAESADALATGADEIAEQIQLLHGEDDGLATSAAQRLAIFRDRAAAPALAQCLRRTSREARVAAALALAVCGTRQSVPPLLAALRDREPLVAQAAAVALENLTGHAEPFDPFAAAALRDKQAAAWERWFAQTKWEQLERELVQRIKSSDQNVVRRAAVALGHVGGEIARESLRQHVARERAHNPYPEWMKRHRGDNARFNALSEANPRTLQAATRSLGYLKDARSAPLLTETVRQNIDPRTANLFLAEAAIQSLGRINTPEAHGTLMGVFTTLEDYPNYTRWYGDHDALIACHASPPHYFILEALDKMESRETRGIVPHIIRSVPTDPDRGLFFGTDDYETLAGRVIRRGGAEAEVVETCLALLGDPRATKTSEIATALSTVAPCWAGHPTPEIRAAQILSLVCRDARYEPRLRQSLDRYQARSTTIARVFDKGIPVVTELPAKHWVCFYLGRTLGTLAQPQSVEALMALLKNSPPEATPGRPDPLGPGVLFLHNDLTPCWRASLAWALGRIGDRRAGPVLLGIVGDMDNAIDTRHAAAEALVRIADPDSMEAITQLAKSYPEQSTRKVLLQATAMP